MRDQSKGRSRQAAPEPPDASDVGGWFVGTPEVRVDRDEILVIGEIAAPDVDVDSEAARAAAGSGRMSRFRQDTRELRIEIALQAEHRYRRQVSWGVRIGDDTELFTTLSTPVMTRLRQPERQVLDTLVAAGVARSRSEALVWSVRLVGEHADEWLGQMRTAMQQVDRLRASGPGL